MEANQLQAKDLRCGNVLYYDSAEGDVLETSIDWQDLKWILEYETGFNLVHSPIHLSEDVLLRLDFEKYSAENFKHKKVEKLRAYLHPIRNGYGIYLDGCYTLPNIKSVHQLQNLYHSLTGEDLTFKK